MPTSDVPDPWKVVPDPWKVVPDPWRSVSTNALHYMSIKKDYERVYEN